jgi:hypothetical protein
MRQRIEWCRFGARLPRSSSITRGANPGELLKLVSACCISTILSTWHTHLSAEDAIKLAMSEYLHVDCRLIQARQCGRLRSHCAHSQHGTLVAVARYAAACRHGASIQSMRAPWSCARRTPRNSMLACSASASFSVAGRSLGRCSPGLSRHGQCP